MNLNKHDRKHKEYLSLQKEINKLHILKWKTPSIKLDKPIKHGYVRSLFILPEYYKYEYYSLMKSAFEFVGQIKVYSKTENFLCKNGKHSWEKHAYMRNVTDPRFSPWIRQSKMNELVSNIEKYSKFLNYVGNIIGCNCNCEVNSTHSNFRPHYEFKNKWCLGEKTEINYLTHYTPILPEIESRMKEIYNKMDREHGWEKIGGRSKDDYGRDYGPLKAEVHAYLHGFDKPFPNDFN